MPPIPGAATHVIDLARVTKRFDGKRQVTALDDITLAIPRGEMVSVVGPSGSGKSTLLNVLGLDGIAPRRALPAGTNGGGARGRGGG